MARLDPFLLKRSTAGPRLQAGRISGNQTRSRPVPGRGPITRREQGCSFEGKFLEAQKLATSGIDKARIVLEISPPETPRFPAQPVKPFQAGLLHPARRLLATPAEKIKSRPDPD